MTASHTVPPIAYGAIYEEETMGTTETTGLLKDLRWWAERMGDQWSDRLELRKSQVAELERVLTEAAARLEGEGVPEDEILQIIGYAKQKMKRDLNPVDTYERYCETIKSWLVRRREGGGELHNLEEDGFCVVCGQYPNRCDPAHAVTVKGGDDDRI